MADATMIETKPKAKRPQFGGHPPAITPDMAVRIAERVCNGLPLHLALRLENINFTRGHWEKAIAKRPLLLARYEERLAQIQEEFLNEMNTCTLKTMPAKVWKYERRFPEYYSIPKGNQTTVTNNTICLGLSDEVSRRAAQLVADLAKKQKAIDITSTVDTNTVSTVPVSKA